jgi:hypothetical protein
MSDMAEEVDVGMVEGQSNSQPAPRRALKGSRKDDASVGEERGRSGRPGVESVTPGKDVEKQVRSRSRGRESRGRRSGTDDDESQRSKEGLNSSQPAARGREGPSSSRQTDTGGGGESGPSNKGRSSSRDRPQARRSGSRERPKRSSSRDRPQSKGTRSSSRDGRQSKLRSSSQDRRASRKGGQESVRDIFGADSKDTSVDESQTSAKRIEPIEEQPETEAEKTEGGDSSDKGDAPVSEESESAKVEVETPVEKVEAQVAQKAEENNPDDSAVERSRAKRGEDKDRTRGRRGESVERSRSKRSGSRDRPRGSRNHAHQGNHEIQSAGQTQILAEKDHNSEAEINDTELITQASSGKRLNKEKADHAEPKDAGESKVVEKNVVRPRPAVIFHKDIPDPPEPKEEEPSAAADTVVEVNPAFALMAHLGLVDTSQETAPTSEPCVDLFKDFGLESEAAIRESEPSTSPGQPEDDDVAPLAPVIEDNSGHESMQSMEDDPADPREDITNVGESETKDQAKAASKVDPEESSPDLDEPPTIIKQEDKKERSKPEDANPAMDLLGFLGSNYDDLPKQSSHSAPVSVFEPVGQPQTSVDFFQNMSSPPEQFSVDGDAFGIEDQKVSKAHKPFSSFEDDDIDSCAAEEELGSSKIRSSQPEAIGEDEELCVPPPSAAPPLLVADMMQKNTRKARRVQQSKKVEEAPYTPSALAPPSLAGDQPYNNRRIRRVKKETPDAIPGLPPPSLAGDQPYNGRKIRRVKAETPVSTSGLPAPSLAGDMPYKGRKIVRMTKSEPKPVNNLPPPSLAGDDYQRKPKTKIRRGKGNIADNGTSPIKAKSKNFQPETVTENETESAEEEAAPKKVGRRLMSKAKSFSKGTKSFAKMSCDDSSLGEDDDDVGEMVVQKKKVVRRGMLKKAVSAASVVQKGSKKLVKKTASSSRGLFNS